MNLRRYMRILTPDGEGHIVGFNSDDTVIVRVYGLSPYDTLKKYSRDVLKPSKYDETPKRPGTGK